MVQKPAAGWKANAYLIFDYFSPTDFKFAGLDASLNKAVLGHRTAAGWVVDAQGSVQGGVVADVGYDFASAFEDGLDLILDALERRLVTS